MPMFLCVEFVQSDEKCGSMSLRDACMKCGKTRAAHDIQAIPAHEIAEQWLVSHGLRDKPYFELVKNILTKYIEDSE